MIQKALLVYAVITVEEGKRVSKYYERQHHAHNFIKALPNSVRPNYEVAKYTLFRVIDVEESNDGNYQS